MGLFKRSNLPDFTGQSAKQRLEHQAWSSAFEGLEMADPLCVVNADGGRIEPDRSKTVDVGMFAVARMSNGHPVLRYAFIDGRNGVRHEQLPSQRVFGLRSSFDGVSEGIQVVAHIHTVIVWTVPADLGTVGRAFESIKPAMHNLGRPLP